LRKENPVTLGIVNHLELRVSNLDRAEAFYDPIMQFLGYCKHHRTRGSILYRRRRGIGDLILSRVPTAARGKTYDPESPGFRHLAFRAGNRQEVDRLHRLLQKMKATVLDAPSECSCSPGYYAVYFADPDGMKLELAYTPFQNPSTREELKRILANTKRKRN
jgi:catechol 2,3-dioxygenase-like lactoylglutathione lyase family enzyme